MPVSFTIDIEWGGSNPEPPTVWGATVVTPQPVVITPGVTSQVHVDITHDDSMDRVLNFSASSLPDIQIDFPQGSAVTIPAGAPYRMTVDIVPLQPGVPGELATINLMGVDV